MFPAPDALFRPPLAGEGARLPYLATSDLPAAVRRLPLHAQEIFLAAFNSAWRSYRGALPGEQEEIAFRVAWAAVKKRFRKRGEIWVARDEFSGLD